jgi:hypothetical protein
LIPGGGGTKEFALRASDSFTEGDVQIPTLIERFKVIAQASVSTSAYEAFGTGVLNKKRPRHYECTAQYRGSEKRSIAFGRWLCCAYAA